jgi:CheB methylesterase
MGSTRGAAKLPVVCVGGSAGCLDAYMRLLRHLPADMGVAIVIVIHLTTVATHLAQQRVLASLAGLFGIVPLLFAALDSTAASVAQRTNEIGLRMALGSSTDHRQTRAARPGYPPARCA